MKSPVELAVEALKAIAAIEPKPFDKALDWEAIDACPECQRYKGHPIQQGICDMHRRPIWDREKHDRHEEAALGYRAKCLALDALAALQPLPVRQEEEERTGLEEIAKFVDDFFAPWGSWKTPWWEGQVSDNAPFSAENALKAVAIKAKAILSVLPAKGGGGEEGSVSVAESAASVPCGPEGQHAAGERDLTFEEIAAISRTCGDA